MPVIFLHGRFNTSAELPLAN